MVRLDVYDVPAICVLVKLVTKPYDGKKLFLDLGVSGFSVCQRSLGVTHWLTFLHEGELPDLFQMCHTEW